MFTLAMMMAMTITANAMSYSTAKNEALFLSDKMAYELNLTAAQYDAVYEINLDYLMSVNGRDDAYSYWWNRRNTDLMFVLTAWQYEKYMGKSYFYRPLTWNNSTWSFNIYSHYTNKGHFYMSHPKGFDSYKGGNNKKSDRYYADRNVNKPTHGNGSTWRNTGNSNSNNHGSANASSGKNHNSANANSGRNHGNSNNRIAHNTGTNHSSVSRTNGRK